MKRLLIVGFGDIARRMLPLLRRRYRIYALSRRPHELAPLRAAGVTPIRGDLDNPDSLDALAGLAQDVVHLAPPPDRGTRDSRSTVG